MTLELAEIHDCIGNPLKLRIMMLVSRNGPMTPKQILQETGASQTTLYRTLNSMQKDGILEVVQESKVRAMTERTYDLSIDFKHFDVDLVNSNDLDGYCIMFSSFSLGLIRDFQEYADDPDADLGRDSTGFASVGLYMTDEEAKELSWKIAKLVEPHLSRSSPEQSLHTMAFILTPPQKKDRVPENGANTLGVRITGVGE